MLLLSPGVDGGAVMGEDRRSTGGFLEVYEELLAAQLRVIRRLRSGGERPVGGRKGRSMSKMGMALDILNGARRPLHISEIIAMVKGTYGVELDRESLASALVKKVRRKQGVMRTAPNTFEAMGK